MSYRGRSLLLLTTSESRTKKQDENQDAIARAHILSEAVRGSKFQRLERERQNFDKLNTRKSETPHWWFWARLYSLALIALPTHSASSNRSSSRCRPFAIAGVMSG